MAVWRRLIGILSTAVIVTVLLALIAPAGQDAANSNAYTPVAPPAAIQHSIRWNLKIVQDWLDQKDYTSAADTAVGVVLLCAVYQCYDSSDEWREKSAAVRTACEDLVAAARAKDAARAQQCIENCTARLEAAAAVRPHAANGSNKRVRPAATNKTLMKLLDGTYADAKGARKLDDLSNLAFVLAEGANLTQHLINEPAWRDGAASLRDAALAIAEHPPDRDLQLARRELKNVYDRCQACHQAYKR